MLCCAGYGFADVPSSFDPQIHRRVLANRLTALEPDGEDANAEP
jgi:hypothetical protein